MSRFDDLDDTGRVAVVVGASAGMGLSAMFASVLATTGRQMVMIDHDDFSPRQRDLIDRLDVLQSIYEQPVQRHRVIQLAPAAAVHTFTAKPLSKRRARRLRGRA